MKKIIVEGKKYKVSEYLGFQHSTGTYNYFVYDENGLEKNAYRYPGDKKWKFWTAKNRLGLR